MKLWMEEIRCDEDREIKLGCPQFGKGVRFAVAFASVIAHKDRFDCTVAAGEELAAWEYAQGSFHLHACWGPMAPVNCTCLSLVASGYSRERCPFTLQVPMIQLLCSTRTRATTWKDFEVGAMASWWKPLVYRLLLAWFWRHNGKYETMANYWECIVLTSNYKLLKAPKEAGNTWVYYRSVQVMSPIWTDGCACESECVSKKKNPRKILGAFHWIITG